MSLGGDYKSDSNLIRLQFDRFMTVQRPTANNVHFYSSPREWK